MEGCCAVVDEVIRRGSQAPRKDTSKKPLDFNFVGRYEISDCRHRASPHPVEPPRCFSPGGTGSTNPPNLTSTRLL